MKNKLGVKKLSLSLVVLTVVLSLGFYFYQKNISADSSSDSVVIPKGWSLIGGESLHQIDLSKVLQSGLLVYSYNDPVINNTKWSFAASDCNQFSSIANIQCVTNIELNPSLSYLVYNSKKAASYQRIETANLINYSGYYQPGWHLLSWNKNGTKRSEFLKELTFTLSDESTQSADKMIDQKRLYYKIYQEEKNSSNKIVFKSLEDTDSPKTTSKLTSGNAWVYSYQSDQEIQQISNNYITERGAFSFGLNRSPSDISKPPINNVGFFQDISNLGTNLIRYINFDLSDKNEQVDVASAIKIKDTGAELMGTFLPQSTIMDKRNSEILSSKGQKYKEYPEVIYDMRLYSGASPDGTIEAGAPQWDKLKELLVEEYFKGIVIPRATLYKDIIKYWQPWNEPDGKIGKTSWGIPPEVLSLLTTGQTKTSSGIITFENTRITGFDGKEYDLTRGASGLTKQICPDCTFASAGFVRNVESYFTTLYDNNYIDYVDANEIHLNLHPNYSMGYLRYWTSIDGQMKIYDALCGGHDNCNKPLYSTEMASPSDAKYIETINKKPTGFTMTFSDNFQADDLMKRFISLPAKGVSKVSWNGYTDSHSEIYNGRTCPTTTTSGFYEFTTPNSLCHHPLKGLYATTSDGAYVKKPSYSAYQIATSKIGYANKIDILKQGNEEHTDIDPIFLFKITDVDGKEKFSGWCEPFWDVTSTNLGKKAWNYEDRDCSKSVSLNEYGLSGKVITTSRDGSINEANANMVTLTKSPIFIEAK